MPTYEYVCRSCGEHCEVVQSFKDAPLTECPNCKGELRKVFGNIGIAFKGSGFYKTDSRSKSSAGSTSKSAEGSSGSESSATKGDSKSESKGDSKGDSKSAPKGDSKTPSSSSATPSAASAS